MPNQTGKGPCRLGVQKNLNAYAEPFELEPLADFPRLSATPSKALTGAEPFPCIRLKGIKKFLHRAGKRVRNPILGRWRI